ncbi:MAG TPA: dihydrodipicolinate synthase family protein, partial [Gemmatimonadota bacterium]|nr:dihydrodipicolinate synthase family protein [Gemmatimonadota bacterium]
LCLPLRYYALDDDVVAKFYRAVAGPLDLPLLAYHIPQRSKVELPAELLVDLAREGTIRGIKDSAGDLALQARLRQDAGRGFSLLDGKASVFAESLALGADGAILAVADAAPEIACGIFAAHRAGDHASARALQARWLPLAECLGPRFGVAGIKAALDLRGWPGGGPLRAPLRALDPEGRMAVAAALEEAGIEIGAPRGA